MAASAYYKHLVLMRHQRSLVPLVEKALALIVEVTRARSGYLALHDESGNDALVRAHGIGGRVSDVKVSRGIVERALRTRRPVLTRSAVTDQRFETLDSVRQHELQAVLCVPVGDKQPFGVVYLERATGDEFTSDDVDDARLLALELEASAGRLVRRTKRTLVEQLNDYRAQLVREALERHANSATAAANELGVERATIYRNKK